MGNGLAFCFPQSIQTIAFSWLPFSGSGDGA
jgi:hypothetical protein